MSGEITQKRRGRPPGSKNKKPPAAALVVTMIPCHDGQAIIRDSPARIKVAACGRRFGKTLFALNSIAAHSMSRPNSVSWWVAPTYDIVQTPFRWACALFAKLFPRPPSIAERTIYWPNGSRTVFRSTERWQHLVGEGLSYLVIDEAGRVPEMAWTESLRPALIDQKGSALIIGTPKGKSHWFYREFLRGQSPDYPEYASWQMPTSANPLIDPNEIEMARRMLPEVVFRQEFLAEFLDSAAGVFHNVEQCIQQYQIPVPPQADKHYFAGLDLAKYSDYTALVIIDEQGRVVLIDRFQLMDWEQQIYRVAQTVAQYRARLVIDSTGVGDPIYERLARMGLPVTPYRFTAESKQRLIEQLVLGIERGELIIPAGSVLCQELSVYEYDLSSIGRIRYAAPYGMHDDTVIALALAWEAIGGTTAYAAATTEYQSVSYRRWAGHRSLL